MTNAQRNRRSMELRSLMCSCGHTRDYHMVRVHGMRRVRGCIVDRPDVCQCDRFTAAEIPMNRRGK